MQKVCNLHYIDSHTNGQEYSNILLLIPGNLATSRSWEALCQQISQLDKTIRLVRIDLRGTGKSQIPREVDCIQDYSEDVKELIFTTLKLTEKECLNKLILVGWSLGGAIVQQLASQYPQSFKKVILISSVPHNGLPKIMQMDQAGVMEGIKSKEELFNQDSTLMNISNNIKEKNVKFFREFWKQAFTGRQIIPEEDLEILAQESILQTSFLEACWACQIFNLSPGNKINVSQIKGPVLIIGGAKDFLFPPIHAERLAEAIGKQKCRVLINDEFGHFLPLEDPKYLAQEIVNFTKEKELQ